MGILTSLVTLPLAPVRGAAWVAQQVAEEAERQLYDQSRLRRELLQLELDRDAGLVDKETYEEQADELLARMAQARERQTELDPMATGGPQAEFDAMAETRQPPEDMDAVAETRNAQADPDAMAETNNVAATREARLDASPIPAEIDDG
jgi:glycine/D-amino acid oxidase-like deaminating enzyme